ncbi:MAG: flagellar biosynthetic protein FliR [Alphaproteobacteria bacterium]|nr:flagellar biosynthetic protein FliR [Alphaproteobacteria bacterium]
MDLAVLPLQTFLTTGVFAFIVTFVRIGTALMIMPGLGDSFVPERIRLYMALSFSLALFPLTYAHVPVPLPATFGLFSIIVMEFIVGLFFGTIARILMLALDTAGMVISASSGLANAQIFNPGLATQGSLIGAFLSITGVAMLFALDLHHLLLGGLVQSYDLFPLGHIPESGSMADFMTRTVAESFATGVKIGAPFLVLTLAIYVTMGVLARLMPQVQVFLLAIPVQVLLAVTLLSLVLSSAYLFWAQEFERAIVFFFSQRS